MAQGLLSARLALLGVPACVASAGMAGGGQPPLPEVISVLASHGVDVTGHRSRAVTAGDLDRADLILGLAREHVRHAVVLLPSAWPRAFTIRELARRGRQAGARAAGEPLGSWLARAAGDRDRRDLLGGSLADDVADPAGGPPHAYRMTAGLLGEVTHELAGLCWPGPCWPGL